MSSPKRVSVLVAIYRSGKFLGDKLKTLQNQSAFNKCQFILLNCQNIDNERSIYEKFATQENVITIEYTDYQYLYATWNDGITLARSDYIMNSNADDMLHPECIEHLINALDNNHDHDVVHGDSYVTDIPNQHWPRWSYHGLIKTMYPLGTAGPCPMWRRSLHDRFGLFDNYRSIGDARIWEKWYMNNVKFLHVPGALSLYYHAPGHNLEVRLDTLTGKSLRTLDLELGADN